MLLKMILHLTFKAYQIEIDGLTQRLQFAENSFLAVYPVFMEAPDPVAVLKECLKVRASD